jgi:predicted aspartyl protease
MYFKNVKLLLNGEIKRKDYVQTVPFEWRKDLIVVSVYLNEDTVAREFIFDTGAFNSKVESQLANSLDLEVVAQKENSTAQGISRTIDVVRIDSMRLGETSIYNLGAGKVKYDKTSASPCVASSGIIGANLIKLAHWKIDYENQLLHFSDKPFEVEEGSFVLHFDRPLLSGVPKVDLELDGITVENIIFDVGYNGGLVLPISIANHFEDIESTIILDKATSGIYGTNTDSLLVKVMTVGTGGLNTEMPVEFSSLNKALLGNEFLKHFDVIINYDSEEIFLTQQKKVEIENSRTFLVAIENDSLWTVSRTTPDIPLDLGDKLLLVNGAKPEEVFSSHCDFVMNIGKLLDGNRITVQKLDGSYVTIR